MEILSILHRDISTKVLELTRDPQRYYKDTYFVSPGEVVANFTFSINLEHLMGDLGKLHIKKGRKEYDIINNRYMHPNFSSKIPSSLVTARVEIGVLSFPFPKIFKETDFERIIGERVVERCRKEIEKTKKISYYDKEEKYSIFLRALYTGDSYYGPTNFYYSLSCDLFNVRSINMFGGMDEVWKRMINSVNVTIHFPDILVNINKDE